MLKHQGTISIETPRLLLRKFRMEDAPLMFNNWATDEKVTQYLTWRSHQSLKVTQDLVETWCTHYNDKVYLWAIVLKGLNEPIGTASLHDVDSVPSFGYCVSSKYWGQGIMLEAMQALMRYWLHDVGFPQICGFYHLQNPASGRVMEKLSMQYKGTATESNKKLFYDNLGNAVECGMYSINREQFDALTVRRAYSGEEYAVGSLYDSLTDYLELHENKCGWRKGCYPTLPIAQAGKASDSLYIAILSGRVAGSCILNHSQAAQYDLVDWKQEEDNPLIVHTMAIHPDFLRKGIAKSLLKFAEALAIESGSHSLRLDTSTKNTSAIALYEKCGYEKRGIIDLGLDRSGIREWYVFEKAIK